MPFGGKTYNSGLDRIRLLSQLGQVLCIMRDGNWRTLSTLERQVDGTEAAISARLRDFRKPKWGTHLLEKRRVGDNGLYEYRLLLPTKDAKHLQRRIDKELQ